MPYMTNQTRRSIEAYAKDYDVHTLRQVGQLQGHNVIRNFNDVDLERFEKYYENERLGKNSE